MKRYKIKFLFLTLLTLLCFIGLQVRADSPIDGNAADKILENIEENKNKGKSKEEIEKEKIEKDKNKTDWDKTNEQGRKEIDDAGKEMDKKTEEAELGKDSMYPNPLEIDGQNPKFYELSSYTSYIVPNTNWLFGDDKLQYAMNVGVSFFFGITKFNFQIFSGVYQFFNDNDVLESNISSVSNMSKKIYSSLMGGGSSLFVLAVVFTALYLFIQFIKTGTFWRSFFKFFGIYGIILMMFTQFSAVGNNGVLKSRPQELGIARVSIRTSEVMDGIGELASNSFGQGRELKDTEKFISSVFSQVVYEPFKAMNGDVNSEKAGQSRYKLYKVSDTNNEDKYFARMLLKKGGDSDNQKERIDKLYDDGKSNRHLGPNQFADKYTNAIGSIPNSLFVCGVILVLQAIKFAMKLLILCLILLFPFVSILSLFKVFEESIFNLGKKALMFLFISGMSMFASSLFLYFNTLIRTLAMKTYNNYLFVFAIQILVFWLIWKFRASIFDILTASKLSLPSNKVTDKLSNYSSRVNEKAKNNLKLAGAGVGGYAIGKASQGRQFSQFKMKQGMTKGIDFANNKVTDNLLKLKASETGKFDEKQYQGLKKEHNHKKEVNDFAKKKKIEDKDIALLAKRKEQADKRAVYDRKYRKSDEYKNIQNEAKKFEKELEDYNNNRNINKQVVDKKSEKQKKYKNMKDFEKDYLKFQEDKKLADSRALKDVKYRNSDDYKAIKDKSKKFEKDKEYFEFKDIKKKADAKADKDVKYRNSKEYTDIKDRDELLEKEYKKRNSQPQFSKKQATYQAKEAMFKKDKQEKINVQFKDKLDEYKDSERVLENRKEVSNIGNKYGLTPSQTRRSISDGSIYKQKEVPKGNSIVKEDKAVKKSILRKSRKKKNIKENVTQNKVSPKKDSKIIEFKSRSS